MSNSIELISADYNINTDLVYPKNIHAINLDILCRNFKLDIVTKEKNNVKEFYTSNNPINFTQIKFNKKEKTEAEEVYNRPPIGPIENGFTCIACGNTYPDHHKIDCINPNKTSLRLNYDGLIELINNIDKPTVIKNINLLRRNKDELKVFIEDHFEDTIGNSPSDINFFDVVPIKGHEKTPYKTAKTAFNNTVFITYTNERNTEINSTERNSNIRIYPSGFIDIKGAPIDIDELENMKIELIKRINDAKCINLNNFNQILSINDMQPKTKFLAIPTNSYYTILRTQFYLFDKKQTDQVIDLDKLNSSMSNKFINTPDIVLVETRLNVDSISKVGNKVKDSLIYKYSLPRKGKLTLQISRFGTFQFTVSNDTNIPLEENLLIMQKLKDFFKSLSETQFTNDNLETKVKFYDKTETTVSGLVPPKSKSQKEGTETCAKNQAGVPIRPDPYTWSGTCPAEGYFVPPVGKQGGDIRETIDGEQKQLYFPCCKKLSQNDRRDYKLYLLNGFPIGENNGQNIGIFSTHDALSGVIDKNPEVGDIITAKTTESDWMRPEFYKAKILAINNKKPISYTAIRLDINSKVNILRTDIKRATRRFRGLNDLSKDQLIQILMKNNMISSTIKDNTTEIEFINVKNINPYLITNDFVNKKYVVGGVPGNSELVYLVNNVTGSNQDQFLVNETNMVIKNTDFNIVGSTTVVGFYDGEIFYAIAIKGEIFNYKNNTLINDSRVVNVQFYENIIKESNLILTNEPDTRLLFIENEAYFDEIIYFYKSNIPDNLTIQLLSNEDNRYTIGYDNKPFSEEEVHIDKIPKSSKITPKIGDYITVKPNINSNTSQLMLKRPFIYLSKSDDIYLNFNHAKSIFNSVFNPITTEDFDNPDYWEFNNQSLRFSNGKLILEV